MKHLLRLLPIVVFYIFTATAYSEPIFQNAQIGTIFETFKETSGLNYLSLWEIFILLIILIFAFLAGRLGRKYFPKKIAFNRISAAFAVSFFRHLIEFSLGLATSIFALVAFWEAEIFPSVEMLAYAFFAYVCFLIFMKALFYPPLPASSILVEYTFQGKKIYRDLFFFGTFLLASLIIYIVLRGQNIGVKNFEILRTIYISLFSILVILIAWRLLELSWFRKRLKSMRTFLKFLLILTLLCLLSLEWLGYHNLSIFFLRAIALTLFAFIITWMLLRITLGLIDALDNNKALFFQRMRYLMAVRPHRKMPELIVLRFAIVIIILYIFLMILGFIWGLSLKTILGINDLLYSGIVIANLNFYPLRIIIALLLFPILLLFGRFISGYFARRHKEFAERDVQVGISSLIIYITFSIALLIFLIIAGVNFTGLAIIAGALSVGIGFGLQSIVHNFVSGIILLLERPVKPGDRIVIGNIEGFVQRVRIRSTRIKTLAKEDIIIPNSDLITQQVTNFMFRDSLWRVVCRLNVAYGSDIDLVKEILLDIASKHPAVLQETRNAPRVLFREFGESALIFELWCIIKNVNEKYNVISELNFAIDKAFRDNNINIAFPQRDIHIKDKP